MLTASMTTSDKLKGRSTISKRMLSASSIVTTTSTFESRLERYGLGGVASSVSMGGVAGTASAVRSFDVDWGSLASCWENSASSGGSFGSVDPSATGALEMSVRLTSGEGAGGSELTTDALRWEAARCSSTPIKLAADWRRVEILDTGNCHDATSSRNVSKDGSISSGWESSRTSYKRSVSLGR